MGKVGTPKVYFVETGLLCFLLEIKSVEQLAVHPLRGAVFENLVINEMLKHEFNSGHLPRLYFYRENAGHEVDFAKYASPLQVARIHALWHSLPAQLSKENRKFIYNVIKSGARSKDYEDALMWLEDAGVIYKVCNVSKPCMPLSAYADAGVFKVYACDVGLLRRLARLGADIVANPRAGYIEFKGAIAENAVLQSLVKNREDIPYYWTSGNRAEVEFIAEYGGEIIPIEVKAKNCVSGRSLAVYNEKYSPEHRFRLSMLNLQKNGNLISCPLPMAEWMH